MPLSQCTLRDRVQHSDAGADRRFLVAADRRGVGRHLRVPHRVTSLSRLLPAPREAQAKNWHSCCAPVQIAPVDPCALMSKVVASARSRSALDSQTRPITSKHGSVRDARKYVIDAPRPYSTIRWLRDVINGGPQDARICIPERRWRDSPFVFVERRKGPRWKYGSIALCAVLWAHVWWLFQR